MKSLADVLGTALQPASEPEPDTKIDAKTFCQKIVASPEFRNYLLNGIALGDLAPAVVCKIMDHAWGKPVDHLEVKDVTAMDSVTEEVIAARLQLIHDSMREMLSRKRLTASVVDATPSVPSPEEDDHEPRRVH